MKVVMLNTYDGGGGAARSAYRLHQGLQAHTTLTAELWVQEKFTDISTIRGPRPNIRRALAKLRPSIAALPLKLYPNHQPTVFSTQWFPDFLKSHLDRAQPDLINLHWIGDGYIQIETLGKISVPMVWTLHDMWAFTGGCHYTHGCQHYQTDCGQCPQLGSPRSQDLSHWIWQRKAKALESANLTIVTPSQWLGECARDSPLLGSKRIEVIPNGLDLQQYRPHDRTTARQILDLPDDRRLILAGAMDFTRDFNKGSDLLLQALKHLGTSDWCSRLGLIVYGMTEPEIPADLPIPCYNLGRLQDDTSLALAYSAADVFVAPSRQENLPNTVMESLACGTPCVAFKIGGMPDLIEHTEQGYLAQPYEVDDLMRGILWVLEQQSQDAKFAIAAREKAVNQFSVTLQAQRYVKLFQELTSNR